MTSHDVIVVGGGPAGLTAAIYLARFHLRTLVIDNGLSRALMIPVTHNHAGYPAGIAGRVLVERMREQAVRYGAVLSDATATTVAGEQGAFRVEAGSMLQARAILLATGVRNRRPPMADALHDRAVATGRLRYCPICDGYEVTDKNIAVIGSGEHGASEALFLRGYSRDVTLIAADGEHDLDGAQRAALGSVGVGIVAGPATAFRLSKAGISLGTAQGRRMFDSVYPALGSTVHSDLARALGAETGSDGGIVVDGHQRSSVPGLYAAGDVVLGLDQISHAMGEGGVAASTIRNDLALIQPLLR